MSKQISAFAKAKATKSANFVAGAGGLSSWLHQSNGNQQKMEKNTMAEAARFGTYDRLLQQEKEKAIVRPEKCR